jgi:pre-mRNA-splicing factor SPF27
MRTLSCSEPHPNLPSIPEPSFSELITDAVEHAGSGKPREGGIDMSRYEEPDEPSSEDDATVWREALRNAYVLNAYVNGRHINLALLEEYGKNAWLLGNSHIDGILKGLDQELAELKEEVDTINRQRKTAQESSHGEIQSLEETWKKSIGRLVEVQLATDKLRRENGHP